jgi:sterol desaturase/sphingolipid hydroxylase (fatty acid hydroxylase superfamily)
VHALPIDANRDSKPIRLFKSDFLEFFSHVSPVTIVVAWLPVIGLLLASAITSSTGPASGWIIPAAVTLGMFLWSAAEYLLHRFLFHMRTRTPVQERIIFLFHGVHHAQPQDKTRLVMPLPVSIPLAVIFYGLFYAVFAALMKTPWWVNPTMAGFLAGYLAYDLTHYATHHFAMRSGYAKYLKRYHMMHHYKDPNTRFGVSSPVWDWVFSTAGTDDPPA